ncbi:MAG: zinc ribbon domain-containing protein [Candidatus Melainabacteria bacterium]|nr:zinc ribbon domain-containing protein [Candidatus Melainabacteria bacterium]
MPRYDYQCMSCQHVFEALQSIQTVADHLPCEQCGSFAKRLLSQQVQLSRAGKVSQASQLQQLGQQMKHLACGCSNETQHAGGCAMQYPRRYFEQRTQTTASPPDG